MEPGPQFHTAGDFEFNGPHMSVGGKPFPARDVETTIDGDYHNHGFSADTENGFSIHGSVDKHGKGSMLIQHKASQEAGGRHVAHDLVRGGTVRRPEDPKQSRTPVHHDFSSGEQFKSIINKASKLPNDRKPLEHDIELPKD